MNRPAIAGPSGAPALPNLDRASIRATGMSSTSDHRSSRKPSFLLTYPLPAPGPELLAAAGSVEVLKRSPTVDELVAASRSGSYDVLVAQLRDKLTETVLKNSRLRGVSVYSAGVDNVDIAAATRNGVMVANTPDVLTDATADVAILLMLASARRAVEADRRVRAGQFAGWSSEFMLGLDVSGRTLGLAGFGRIARATARRALGFDMRVLYCPRPPGDAPSSNPDLGVLAGRVERRSWPELIAESDFLSLHVPLAEDTHHLVDGDTFKAMKSSAVLVNTARGPIVDEGALVQALRSGEIAAAGLDVYEHEPAVADGLLELANTVLLPHIGSATVSVRAEMARLCAQNAVELAAGREPLAAVNPEAWSA